MAKLLFALLVLVCAVAFAHAQDHKAYLTHAFDMKCDVCQVVVHAIKGAQGDIKTLLAAECDKLEVGQEMCKKRLLAHSAEIAASIDVASPEEICHKIQWCIPNRDYFNIIPAGQRVAVPEVEPQAALLDLRCVTCQTLFTYLYARLGTKQNATSLTASLKAACAKAPIIVQGLCNNIINNKLNQIVPVFDQRNPSSMCQYVKLCSSGMKRSQDFNEVIDEAFDSAEDDDLIDDAFDAAQDDEDIDSVFDDVDAEDSEDVNAVMKRSLFEEDEEDSEDAEDAEDAEDSEDEGNEDEEDAEEDEEDSEDEDNSEDEDSEDVDMSVYEADENYFLDEDVEEDVDEEDESDSDDEDYFADVDTLKRSLSEEDSEDFDVSVGSVEDHGDEMNIEFFDEEDSDFNDEDAEDAEDSEDFDSEDSEDSELLNYFQEDTLKRDLVDGEDMDYPMDYIEGDFDDVYDESDTDVDTNIDAEDSEDTDSEDEDFMVESVLKRSAEDEDADFDDEDEEDLDDGDVDEEDVDSEFDEVDRGFTDDGLGDMGVRDIDPDNDVGITMKRIVDPINEDSRVFYYGLDGKKVVAKKYDDKNIQILASLNTGGAECQICQWAVSAVEAYISQQDTEAELARVLQELCTVLPGNYATICQNFVVVYMDEAVNYVIDNLTPPLVCSKLDICLAPPAQTPSSA